MLEPMEKRGGDRRRGTEPPRGSGGTPEDRVESAGAASSRSIAQAAMAAALIAVIQAAGLPRFLTGSGVNAVYVFLCLHSGPAPALLLCFASPLCALLTGHLPPLLAPLVPVIMLGNATLVWGIHLCRNRFRGYLATLLLPSTAKSIAITGGSLLYLRTAGIGGKLEAMLGSIAAVQFFSAAAGTFIGLELHRRLEETARSARSRAPRSG